MAQQGKPKKRKADQPPLTQDDIADILVSVLALATSTGLRVSVKRSENGSLGSGLLIFIRGLSVSSEVSLEKM